MEPKHGLRHDLPHLTRRDLVRWLSAAALIPSAACVKRVAPPSDDDAPTGDDATVDTVDTADTFDGTCATIPEETAGPYPGDGTNGANALKTAGIVRSDIRTSVGSFSGTAAGVPLTVRMRLVSVGGACAVLPGHAVYLWHCTRDGLYSLYTLTTENYLRGVQEADEEGFVTFQTVFPGCYPGRWPHLHFEVFASLDDASNGRQAVATSQVALPRASCVEAYTSAGYEASVTYLASLSLATDGVFRDGAEAQIPSIVGNPTDGYVCTITVGVG